MGVRCHCPRWHAQWVREDCDYTISLPSVRRGMSGNVETKKLSPGPQPRCDATPEAVRRHRSLHALGNAGKKPDA